MEGVEIRRWVTGLNCTDGLRARCIGMVFGVLGIEKWKRDYLLSVYKCESAGVLVCLRCRHVVVSAL